MDYKIKRSLNRPPAQTIGGIESHGFWGKHTAGYLHDRS